MSILVFLSTDILMFYHIQQENNNVLVETLFDQFVCMVTRTSDNQMAF